MIETFMFPPATPSAIGLRVPDFTVPATGGEFTLSAHLGKPVVLYFYPRTIRRAAPPRPSSSATCTPNSPRPAAS
jgi:peroxiredoxin